MHKSHAPVDNDADIEISTAISTRLRKPIRMSPFFLSKAIS